MEIQYPPHLQVLQNDMLRIGSVIEELANETIERGISRYPIFIVAPQQLSIGISFAEPHLSNTNYYYRISTLEELINKHIILASNVTSFKNTYKNPLDNVCILFIKSTSPTFESEFVFFPYQSIIH